MKKVSLYLILTVSKLSAYAEAGKGLSRISTSDILWGIFLFGFAIPASLGLIVYLVLKRLNRESKPSLTLIIFVAVLVWWLGWWVALIGKHY